MALYRILEDEKGRFWVAKISDSRIVLSPGTFDNIDKTPNKIEHVGFLKDYTDGRTITYNFHAPTPFI